MKVTFLLEKTLLEKYRLLAYSLILTLLFFFPASIHPGQASFLLLDQKGTHFVELS